MQKTVGEHAYSEVLSGFAMWPDMLHWSFQFIRMVSMGPTGGGDFTEVFTALRDVKAGDTEAWYQAMTTLAGDLDRKAAASLAGGHPVSAREMWLRASNYYRAAGFFYDMENPRCVETVDARRRTFRSAGELFDPPIEPVEVPYENGTTLPGYIVPPARPAAGPTPAAIVFGGGDSITENMYFHIGRSLSERGFTVLLVDGPGMGEALRRGISARYDWEVPTGAAVDFLLERGGVDPDRIGLIAESLGGYYSARGAAFEPRIKACVVWGAFYSFPLTLVTPDEKGELPAGGRPARRLISLTGARDAAEARELLSKFTLEGVTENMHCATLILIAGAEDGFLRKEGEPYQPYPNPGFRILDEIPHDKKKLVEFPSGGPGAMHCQGDSHVSVQPVICDWLEETFAS